MQLFLDSTDTAVIKDLASTGLVDGVTTNPSLIAKSGRPMLEVIVPETLREKAAEAIEKAEKMLQEPAQGMGR